MTEKEFRFDCKAHSGIRAELDDLKESERDQWEAVKGLQTSKASSSQMKWVIGIFLVLSMATVTFLWRAQVSSTDTIVKKIETLEHQNAAQREATNSKIDSMKERLNELCWTVDGLKKK